MKCPKCGKLLPDDSKFCIGCGTNLFEFVTAENKIICPHCGAETEKGNYCTNCRGALTETALQNIQQEEVATAQQMQLQMQAAQLKLQQESKTSIPYFFYNLL